MLRNGCDTGASDLRETRNISALFSIFISYWANKMQGQLPEYISFSFPHIYIYRKSKFHKQLQRYLITTIAVNGSSCFHYNTEIDT